MKSYNRRKLFFSLTKLSIAAAIFTIAAIVSTAVDKKVNEFTIMFGGFEVTLWIIAWCPFVIIEKGFKYSYSSNCINLLYMAICYRKLSYSDFSAICVSNAAYNNGIGTGPYTSVPMTCKKRTEEGTVKMVLPFITFHKSEYPFNKIISGLYSREIFLMNRENAFCLGICWFDSLLELMEHTIVPILVLEDVYLRFRREFDSVFVVCANSMNRIYIINDSGIHIEYPKYQQQTNKTV